VSIEEMEIHMSVKLASRHDELNLTSRHRYYVCATIVVRRHPEKIKRRGILFSCWREVQEGSPLLLKASPRRKRDVT
jgi:hypothetical protein